MRNAIASREAVTALAIGGRHTAMFAICVLAGVLVTLTEAFGVALIVPLVSPQGANPLQRVPLLGALVDQLLVLPRMELIKYVAVMLMLTALLRGLTAVGHRLLLEMQRERLEADLRTRVIDQLLSVQPHYLEGEKVGNLGTILVGHVAIAGSIVDRLATTASALLQSAILVLIMLLISVRLGLLAMVLLGLAFWITRLQSAGWLDRLGREANEAIVETQQSLIEIASNIRSVHYLGIGPAMRARALGHITRYARVQKWRQLGLSLASPIFTMTIGLIIGVLLLIAAYAYDDGSAPIASVLALLLMMTRLVGPASAISEAVAYVMSGWHQVAEMLRFLDTTDKPYLPDGRDEAPRLPGDIRFDNVGFRYTGRNAGVHGVDMEITAGCVTAIAGPSGSGKSTLVSLLARLFDPSDGRILVGGRDIRSFRLDTWRARLAVVAQDTLVLNNTIAENLRLMQPDATDAELWRALEEAGAGDYVRELPAGIETQLGDRGMNLSGGQRQRLSIARAILSRRQVIILDEATSQLDVETEQFIQDTIDRLRGKHTIILIAHRLATIRSADVIYMMSEGRVVDRGTHAELMGRSGLYQRFVTLQTG